MLSQLLQAMRWGDLVRGLRPFEHSHVEFIYKCENGQQWTWLELSSHAVA